MVAPARRLLRRLLAASAADVARGGESGPWQWLLPALVVVLIGFGAQAVLRAGHDADSAGRRAAQASGFTAAAIQSQALAAASAATPADPDVRRMLHTSMRQMGASLAALQRAAPEDPAVGTLGPSVTRAWTAVHGSAAAGADGRSAAKRVFASLVADARGVESELGARAGTAEAGKRRRTEIALSVGLALVLLLMWTFWAKRARVALAHSERRFDADRTEFQERLRWQAFHDALTGLPNRPLFEDRVTHALERLRRYDEEVAVLFIDLDDFKTINDSLGHAAGDTVLREFALRLGECTRRSDTAARFGGDEFAVLVEGPGAGHAAREVADRIHERTEGPVQIDGEEVPIGASIGIAIGGGEATASELVRNADIAMYAAKAGRGTQRSALFEPSMHDAARRRQRLSSDLRRALRDDRLTVNYQPLMRLSDQSMVGAEALARWNHETLGEIPPGEFIPLAEENGTIVQIGRHVLAEACRQMQCWREQFPDDHPEYVSVNLSVRQFQPEGQVVADVRAAAAAVGLDPSHLMLEVTESILMHDPEPMIRDLTALRDMGARIAIDDFGTGYSALSYLRQFPIDTIKMDRSFVRDLGHGRADSALMRSIVELGGALDMRIIAEGIEEEGQLASVSGLRCDVGQGYLFYPPLDAPAMIAALDEASHARRAIAGERVDAAQA